MEKLGSQSGRGRLRGMSSGREVLKWRTVHTSNRFEKQKEKTALSRGRNYTMYLVEFWKGSRKVRFTCAARRGPCLHTKGGEYYSRTFLGGRGPLQMNNP